MQPESVATLIQWTSDLRQEAPPLRTTPVDPHADLKPQSVDCGAVARAVTRTAYAAAQVVRKKVKGR